MPYDAAYREVDLTRGDIEQTSGQVLLEFGANWCGICQSLSPTLKDLLDEHPQVQHIRVADGKGKRLGRSFGVKLWPTLIFLRDGEVVAQLVRPDGDEVRRSLAELSGS